jgi:hypothetical protein
MARLSAIGAVSFSLVLIGASAAFAQNKVVLPESVNVAIQGYTDCIGSKAIEQKASPDSAEVVIDRAIESCTRWRDLVRDEVMRPPLNASSAEADSAMQYMLRRMRPEMIDTFKRLRGS